VLEGRVRFLDGRPAEIPLVVRLTLGPEGAGKTVLGGYVVRADAEGVFRCEGLGENEYLVEPEAPFQAVPRPLPVRPGTRLDLVAVTAAQEPGLRVEVVFEARDDAPGAGPAVLLRFTSRSGGPTLARGLVATTRPGGYLTEAAVPAGEYEVWLTRVGREDRSLGILRLEGGSEPARLTVPAVR
jgi:hypothetical protein